MKTVQDGQREGIIEDSPAYSKLFMTLDAMQNEKRIQPAVADAIRFIALTGVRRSEATDLLWCHIDFKSGRIDSS